MAKVILVIGGHGKQVLGKYSPKITSDMKIDSEFTENGRFREWKYNRVVADQIVTVLQGMGYDARNIVPEDDDVSLANRVSRVNKICDKYGAGNVFLLEIHANASGNGNDWMPANGWEIYTTVGKTKSDTLAQFIYERAKKNMPDRKFRTDTTDGDNDKEYNYYVIRNVKCPAILSENFFYDNKNDLLYMTSDEGIHCVVRAHVEGALDFLQWLG